MVTQFNVRKDMEKVITSFLMVLMLFLALISCMLYAYSAEWFKAYFMLGILALVSILNYHYFQDKW